MRLFILSLILFLNKANVFAVMPQDSIGLVLQDGKRYIQYLVEKGETLYRISTKYGIAVADLTKTNPELENGLKLGQILLIPRPLPKISETAYSKTDSSLQSPYIPKAKQDTTFIQTIEKESIGNKKVELSVSNSISTKTTYENAVKRVLVIPFDPYLYFSDADDEIASASKINRTRVRQAFRRRLNAYLEPKGFETIHLLGGNLKDSTTDLNLAYGSITYTYDNVTMKALRNPSTETNQSIGKTKKMTTHDKELSLTAAGLQSRSMLAKDEGKYFAVKIKDPNFFAIFNTKYHPDYYIFVSQFEVKTNYENCLDRARQNYERNFVTHFSIFDNMGNLVSGGRVKNQYESNNNRIEKILADNIPAIAEKIMDELPR
jgi:LysM repeat protein